MPDEDLLPVFIPPLALVLANAAKQKGSDLGRDEVEAIRDRAMCMMMKRADAKTLEASRGFRDIEPEDAWADWHRLKVEVTGKGYLPKLILCVVGDAPFAERAKTLLAREAVEHEVRDADPRMRKSFEASAFRLEPSLDEGDLAAVANHTHVLYALSPNFTAGAAIATSQRFLALGARMLDECGGAAMKIESSGIAHGRTKWLALARASTGNDPDDAMAAAVRAFVQFPVGDAKDFWTCGMHLLGRPDFVVARDVLEPREAARLFDTFAVYLLAECGDERHFSSGNTFRCDTESPRLRATWEACEDYEEDEFFFNPFGRYRFAPSA
jgi:hypothetical protein